MLPTWIYAKDEGGLFVNLFAGSDITVENVAGTDVRIVQATDYPWSGKVSITVHPKAPKKFSIRIRVPDRGVSELYRGTPDANGIVSLAVNGSASKPAPVKGYAANERGVFEEVTNARSAVARAQSPAEAGAADSLLGQALGRLFAVAEAYPDLKASQNFLELQGELTDTEDKIAAARRYYNATVLAYNTAIQTIPSLLLAGPLGFRAREFFDAPEGEREPVAVSFAT